MQSGMHRSRKFTVKICKLSSLSFCDGLFESSDKSLVGSLRLEVVTWFPEVLCWKKRKYRDTGKDEEPRSGAGGWCV